MSGLGFELKSVIFETNASENKTICKIILLQAYMPPYIDRPYTGIYAHALDQLRMMHKYKGM